MAYFKFSPIASNFSLLTLTDREIASGLIFSLPVGTGGVLSFGIDVAQLNIVIVGQKIQSRSISLGVDYGF